MTIHIRKARREDVPRIRELIVELAVFEKEPNAVETTHEELEKYGFGDSAMFTCFVAEVEDAIVGIALVYFKFSTWKGRVLYLEDLIVTDAMRGKGVGGVLYKEVMKFGHEHGVKRIDWEVIDWNEGAKKFYENSGARILDDWRPVQMDAQGIANLIGKNEGI